MDIAPNGMAIVSETELKYINSKGKQLMAENKLDANVSSLQKIENESELINERENEKTLHTRNGNYVTLQKKQIQFDEQPADLIVFNDISYVFEIQ